MTDLPNANELGKDLQVLADHLERSNAAGIGIVIPTELRNGLRRLSAILGTDLAAQAVGVSAAISRARPYRSKKSVTQLVLELIGPGERLDTGDVYARVLDTPGYEEAGRSSVHMALNRHADKGNLVRTKTGRFTLPSEVQRDVDEASSGADGSPETAKNPWLALGRKEDSDDTTPEEEETQDGPA